MTGSEPFRRLVLIGAGGGMGRWLFEHVLSRHAWTDLTFVDRASRSHTLVDLRDATSAGTVRVVLADIPGVTLPDVANALVIIAVPADQYQAVARLLAGWVGIRSATCIVVADRLETPLSYFSNELRIAVSGVHPLFDRTAISCEGHTVYLVSSAPSDPVTDMVVALVRDAGGAVQTGSAQRHDRVMSYVQDAAHQTLLNFVDVLTMSGLDFGQELWAARTPLFETLFGLAVRVLSPGHRSAIEAMLASPGAELIAQELLASATATSNTMSDGTVSSRLNDLAQAVDGALFDTAQRVAKTAVDAVRSARSELAARCAAGDVVGLRLDRKREPLHVGTIIEVGPTEVLMEDLLLKTGTGTAVLATEAGRRNARRLGVNGRPTMVRLSLGQVRVVAGRELETVLDEVLTFVRRDHRFLVPESVSAAGVRDALRGTPATRAHQIVSDVVRYGQRSVVIGVEIRSDHDVDTVLGSLHTVVQRIFVWPEGLCRPTISSVRDVAYLGPAGTFSELAAASGARAAGIEHAVLVAVDSLEGVLARAARADTVGVIPVCSSSSGLVTRACTAMSGAFTALAAGGMVDVPIRFDAYLRADITMEAARGTRVFSHPQALAQCTGFIRRWQLEPVPATSTAEGLRTVAGLGGPSVALAAAGAELDGVDLAVGEREVDDISGSITRFLVVGRPDSFTTTMPEHEPTVRTIWLAAPGTPWWEGLLRRAGAGYDEVLTDDVGHALVISSRPRPEPAPGVRILGDVPWSPRTPLVRAGSG